MVPPVIPKRLRGRPRKQDQRAIADALIAATECLLERQGFSHLTERCIAEMAGVSESTIPYYFGDKNGLLSAVVDRTLAFIEERLSSLMEIDPTESGASLQFARALVNAYHTRPWIARLMTAEQQRNEDSPIWQWYAKRRGPRSLVQLRTALLRHAAARYGRVVGDERSATRGALTLLCMTTGPLSMCALSEPVGIGQENLREDAWLQHVAHLVDFHIYLLGGGAGGDLHLPPLQPPGIVPKSRSNRAK